MLKILTMEDAQADFAGVDRPVINGQAGAETVLQELDRLRQKLAIGSEKKALLHISANQLEVVASCDHLAEGDNRKINSLEQIIRDDHLERIYIDHTYKSNDSDGSFDKPFSNIDEAMPAPKQEPVAWRRYAGIVCGSGCFTYRDEKPVQDEGFEWHPLYYHPAPPQAAAIPDNWKQLILDAMDEGFSVRRELGNLADGGLVYDDTQLGVEFAINHFNRWLSAAPKPEGEQ